MKFYAYDDAIWRNLTFIDDAFATVDELKKFGHSNAEIDGTNNSENHRSGLINCGCDDRKIVGNATNEQTAKTYADAIEKQTNYDSAIKWVLTWSDAQYQPFRLYELKEFHGNSIKRRKWTTIF